MAEQKLPKSIQAQLDAAEALEKQMHGDSASEKGNTEAEAAGKEVEAKEPEQAEEAPKKETAEAQVVSDDDAYKKRYEILTGKYNAEVPRLHDQLREQSAAIEAMQRELEAVRKANTQKPEPKHETLLTSKDNDEFGEDLVDMARRAAKDEVAAALDRIRQVELAIAAVSKVPDQIKQIETRQHQTVEQQFWATINKEIPDWQSIDNNPLWAEFLETRAPFSVRTYRALALEAIQQSDVDAIVELVNRWKDESGVSAKESAKAKKDQELRSQAQPGSKKAAPAPSSNTEKEWTAKEYEAAFDPRLTRTMAQADVIALQEAADKAYAEGRVQW